MAEKLGIIAGSGQYPALAARNAANQGLEVFVIGLHGFTDQVQPGPLVHLQMFHLGQFNKILDYFHAQGVQKVCMAGAINKIRAFQLRPDPLALKLAFSLKNKGDDKLLRALAAELEAQGLQLVSAAAFVPDLYTPPGLLTRTRPDQTILADLNFAWPIARSLGQHDIGQCLVVREGVVVAVEGLEGTDATLTRGAQLGGKGCVALKLSKPGQDLRLDLPAIGLRTIKNLITGKYKALILEAHKTLFFDRQEAVQLANKHELCIVALESGESISDLVF